MNRYTDRHLGRRDLLKALGVTAAGLTCNRLAAARHLIVVNTSGAEQISRVEWIPYDTGRRSSDGSAQQRRFAVMERASGQSAKARACSNAA